MADLYDQYGNKIDTGYLVEKEQAPPTPVVRSIYSHLYPTSSLTVEKLITIHRQSDFGDPFMALEMYEEMEEKDQHYNAVLNKRKLSVAGLEFTIDPVADDRVHQEMADFATKMILGEDGLNLREHVPDIMDALGKGFSTQEIIWELEERLTPGKKGSSSGLPVYYRPGRLAWRDPRWFMFDWISGEALLVRTLRTEGQPVQLEMRQQVVNAAGQTRRPAHAPQSTWVWNDEAARIGIQPLTAPLKPWKFITHFSKAKSGLPIRSGLGRCVSFAYLFKQIGNKDWAGFVERFGQPIRVGKYPPGATDQDKQALLAAVARLGADVAGIVPANMEIIFQSAQGMGRSAAVFKEYLEYLENLISKLVLGATLATQMGPRGGSYAAAKVHEGVEASIVTADAMRLAACLNRDLLMPFIQLNYGEQEVYPLLRCGIPKEEDLDQKANMLGTLADHGAKIGMTYVRQAFALPAPIEGEELLTPKQAMAAPMMGADGGLGLPGQPPGQSTPKNQPAGHPQEGPAPNRDDGAQRPRQVALHARTRADHERFGHPADIATSLANDLIKRRASLAGLRDPIMAAMHSATSYDDAMARLETLAEEMAPEAFREGLEEALLAARLYGGARSA